MGLVNSPNPTILGDRYQNGFDHRSSTSPRPPQWCTCTPQNGIPRAITTTASPRPRSANQLTPAQKLPPWRPAPAGSAAPASWPSSLGGDSGGGGGEKWQRGAAGAAKWSSRQKRVFEVISNMFIIIFLETNLTLFWGT